ncbi:MAG: metallophosphoesterase family protein [bacterium]
MQYAIYSDVHGNLQALKAVVADIEKAGTAKKIFLGDAVGYGANPNECIKIIREFSDIALAGNHDHAALNLIDISFFNPFAKEAVFWTRKQLTRESREFLAGLKVEESLNDITLVHATPCLPEEWNYIFSLKIASDNFKCFDRKICFIGHSHVPIIVTLNEKQGRCYVNSGDTMNISSGCRYIINIGSVGQPRDGDNRSSYVLYDDEIQTVTIKRVAYDIAETQSAIIKAGLPSSLAERLGHGR